MKSLVISVLACLLMSNQLFSAEKMRIAVIDFTPNNISKYAAKAVSDNISIEMTKKGDFVMIERSQMTSILSEQGLQQTGCTDTACAVEMGKLLSARKILVGTVTKIGSVFTMNAKVVDVQSGKIDFAESERCNKEDDIDAASRVLAVKLINRITGKSYRLPARSYTFEQTRNRFSLDAAYRYVPKRIMKVWNLNQNGSMIVEDVDKKNFWNVRIIPGYEFNDFFTVKIPGIFTKGSFGTSLVKSYTGDYSTGYFDGKTYKTIYTKPREDYTGYGAGLEMLLSYPLEGYKPFVSLGINYMRYSCEYTNTSIENMVELTIYQDNSGTMEYYQRDVYYLPSVEYDSLYGDISIGSTVEVSKYFEIVVSLGIEVPLYEKYKFKLEAVSDTGIKSSSSTPPNSTTSAYLNSQETSFIKSEKSTFSHIAFFIQAGFTFRLF